MFRRQDTRRALHELSFIIRCFECIIVFCLVHQMKSSGQLLPNDYLTCKAKVTFPCKEEKTCLRTHFSKSNPDHQHQLSLNLSVRMCWAKADLPWYRIIFFCKHQIFWFSGFCWNCELIIQRPAFSQILFQGLRKQCQMEATSVN